VLKIDYLYQHNKSDNISRGCIEFFPPIHQKGHWSCPIKITGLSNFENQIHGEDSFHAFEMALKFSVTMLLAEQDYDVWRIEKGDGITHLVNPESD